MPKGVVTKRKKDQVVNIPQLIRLMAGTPTALEIALGAKFGERVLKQKELAKKLHVSIHVVRSAINKLKALPPNSRIEDIPKTRPKGRPPKNLNIPAAAEQYILNRDTLRA